MGFPFLLQKKGEGMSNLRTNYKDDVFTGKRKYNEIDNGDGSISFDDVTDYTQNGDTYGAAQINEVNAIINNLDNNTYSQTDSAESVIADNDYFPFFDSSANAKKKTLWSNIKALLTQTFAIKVHNSNTAGTYGAGNASYFGHVKLSDNYTTSAGAASASVGASSQAVNSTYNKFKSQLTANNKEFYFDYKNGKYGYNTSANRGADSFVPFNSIPLPFTIHIDHYRGDTNDWTISTQLPAIFFKNSGATYVSASCDNRASMNIGDSKITWGFMAEHGNNEKVAFNFSNLQDTDIVTLSSTKSGTVGGTSATFTFSN